MSDDEIYEIFHLVIEYGGEWDEPSKSSVDSVLHAISNDLEVKLMFRHIEEDPIHGYYIVFIETEEIPKIIPIHVEESPLQLGYDKPKIKKKKKSTRCLEKTSRPLKVHTSKTFNTKSLKRKAKTKSQKPKVKKVRADYLFEEELDDLTKDYVSEEEFKIKEEDVDNVDEEVARWTREKLMRQFESNEFEDLTKNSLFDNVDAEEDYHSNHTSQDGDDVPTMDHIEDHKGFADNRDFAMASSNLYEKEDHEDEEPFLPPQALEFILTIGMELTNISKCRSFMRNFVITQRFTFRQMKNESKRIRYVCKDRPSCPCGKNGTLNRNTNIIWVAKEIENLIRDASTTKLIQISDIVYRRFGVRVSYYTAWNTRNMVMEKIVGSYDKGYALCLELCVEIQKSNPGRIATCSREDGNLKFTDMYISFKAALDGFSKGCRPILGLDGCFLKGKSECQATWMKFLTLVQGQLTLYPSKLAFIFDRQKGLVEAVSQVFPHSSHRFCFRHMYKNFKQLYRGTYLMTLAWNASKAYKKTVIKENLDKLRIVEPDAKTWLEKEPYESWCRSYFDASTKCEHVTNNFLESFNNWIVKIIDKPGRKTEFDTDDTHHFRVPRQDPNARGEHGGYRGTQTSRGLAHWSGASGQGEPSNRVTNKAAPMVCFYYLLTSEAEHRNDLRLLAEEAVTTEDEAASVRPRESCRHPSNEWVFMGSRFGSCLNFSSSSLPIPKSNSNCNFMMDNCDVEVVILAMVRTRAQRANQAADGHFHIKVAKLRERFDMRSKPSTPTSKFIVSSSSEEASSSRRGDECSIMEETVNSIGTTVDVGGPSRTEVVVEKEDRKEKERMIVVYPSEVDVEK
ncbi:hypothetical protein GIB67_029569 [Kingdonia uniflora]|uniref:MULE transposase domain-containing protein n=1 Tax=Kingdonia uniflora TaxID=39325 RepID=A0A7J7LLH8_9MAGN|nr:hypothetical protein GIB67_029569 [Kingdonia uniflora]